MAQYEKWYDKKEEDFKKEIFLLNYQKIDFIPFQKRGRAWETKHQHICSANVNLKWLPASLCGVGFPTGIPWGKAGVSKISIWWNACFIPLATRQRLEWNEPLTKQLPLKKTLIFLFLDFLRGIATATFIRKHNKYNLNKIRKPKSFVIIKILAFFVFLLRCP